MSQDRRLEDLVAQSGSWLVQSDGFAAQTIGQIERRRSHRRFAAAILVGAVAMMLPAVPIAEAVSKRPPRSPGVPSLTDRAVESIGQTGDQFSWAVAETVAQSRAGRRGISWSGAVQ